MCLVVPVCLAVDRISRTYHWKVVYRNLWSKSMLNEEIKRILMDGSLKLSLTRQNNWKSIYPGLVKPRKEKKNNGTALIFEERTKKNIEGQTVGEQKASFDGIWRQGETVRSLKHSLLPCFNIKISPTSLRALTKGLSATLDVRLPLKYLWRMDCVIYV